MTAEQGRLPERHLPLPGTYNVRWFVADGYTRLATSADVTVNAP